MRGESFISPILARSVQNPPVSATVYSVSSGNVTAREEYRRRIQQRQTIVFGTVSAIMAALLLLAMLVWSGVIPFPFDREFTAAPDPNAVVTPCLPEGTTDPVDLAAINVNVYNSTTQPGLAGDVGGSLGKLGVVVSNTDNWSGETLDESARIRTGPTGVAAAYTLSQYISGSVIQFNADQTTDTLDVVVGSGWEKVLSTDEVKQAHPEGKLQNAAECVPLEDASK